MKNACSNYSIGGFILLWIFKQKLELSLKEMLERRKELIILSLYFSEKIFI